MKRTINIFLVIFLILAVSCGTKDWKKGKPIPQEKMVDILAELYLADGLLGYPPIRNQYSAKDSTGNYADVIKKYGYTKEEVDRSLKFYFIENPKKLQKIYDKVLARLSEMEAGLTSEAPVARGSNLWNQKGKLSVPEEGSHSPLYFSIPVKDTGMYVISFNAILFNDDQSINPHTFIFFWHTNETADGVRDPWDKMELIRDGTRRSYSIRRRLTDTTYTHICGWLFQTDPQPGSWIKHGEFSSITVSKVFVSIE